MLEVYSVMVLAILGNILPLLSLVSLIFLIYTLSNLDELGISVTHPRVVVEAFFFLLFVALSIILRYWYG